MQKGFTMVELMLVAGLFVLVFAGLLLGYATCLNLNDFNRNLTLATNINRLKVEELRNQGFAGAADVTLNNTTLMSTYNLNGSCNIDVETVTTNDLQLAEVKDVRAVICWRDMGGRIIGEDKNLDGIFDIVGEDANGSGKLDSPCVIETAIANK